MDIPQINSMNSSEKMEVDRLTPLLEGYELVSEYLEKCLLCGEFFWRRISISPSNLVHNERTACSCVQESVPEEYKKQERQRQRALIRSLFGGRNMLAQKGCQHMRFERYEPGHISQQKAFEFMRAWIPEKGSICLAGLPGRGKTHLAISAAFEAEKVGYSVVALKTMDLLGRLRKCYQSENESDVAILELLKTIDVLVLDDIGVEKVTDWVAEKLYEIVDARYGAKATIYTTNLTGDEMSKKLSLAISSRVYGVETVLILEGNDRRLRKQDVWSDIGEEVFQVG